MVHGILQFTPSIAFRYVLHRCKSRDIRCRESFLTLVVTRRPDRMPSLEPAGRAEMFGFLGAFRAGVLFLFETGRRPHTAGPSPPRVFVDSFARQSWFSGLLTTSPAANRPRRRDPNTSPDHSIGRSDGRLPGPVGQGYRLVEYISVARVRPRTSKGITDLLLPQTSVAWAAIVPLRSWPWRVTST
ncbi:hypothetical protein HN51_001724 [Arachis hypogaea]